MCSNQQRDPQYAELEEFINEIPDKTSSLIAVLHKAQEIFGYLPEDVQRFVAKQLNQPVSEVNGVVTFYSYFTEVPT